MRWPRKVKPAGPGEMRAFIALDLPEALRAPLVRLAATVPVGRAVPEENLHLTLVFLGEITEAQAVLAHEVLEELALAPARIGMEGLDLLGTGRGSVLVARMTGPEALQGQIERALRQAGFALERRRFRPHVTLARLPRRLTAREKRQLEGFLAAHTAMTLPAAPAAQVSLIRSQLHPDGARYEVLSEHDLAEASER